MLTPHVLLVLAVLSAPPPALMAEAVATPFAAPATAQVGAIDSSPARARSARIPAWVKTRRLVRKRLESDESRPTGRANQPGRFLNVLAAAERSAAILRLRAHRHDPTRPAHFARMAVAGAAASLLHLPPPTRLL